jgi:outer membrane protein assembly factor BamB
VVDGKVFVTSALSDKPMKKPSLGVDFSNDYVAELMKQGKSQEEVMKLVTERDNELPHEIELDYALYCIDLDSGKTLWKSNFFEGRPPVGRHRKNSYTSETPVTDGKSVYVYVTFHGLYAFDLEGKQLWHTPLKAHKVYLDFGSGSSPVLHGDKLIICNDNEEASFIAAFDKNTGKQLWRKARTGIGSRRAKSGWSTPFVWENSQRTEIITLGPGLAISYGMDGEELWRMGRIGQMTIASPFAWDGLLYLTSGVSGDQVKPIAAIRPGAKGDITLPEDVTQSDHVVWYNRIAGGTYLPTPVIYKGGVYVLSDKGIFARYDAKTGKNTYKSRIHPEAYNFTSSPWAYNDMIFCINEEGKTFVIKAGEEFELLGVNYVDDITLATPAIAGDRLLIRTQETLLSIRGSKE